MKKLLSTLLVLAMVLSLGSLTALAEDKTTTVTYSVAEPTYTVTIPATAELDEEFSITAENVTNLAATQRLTVKVTDWTKATAGDGFVLANGSAYIPCTVKKGTTGDAIALGDAVMSVNANGTAPLYITKTDANGVYAPGTYTGTMTFTVALETVIVDYTGTGIQSDPYVVYTKKGLQTVMTLTDNETNYIELANDIDATGEYVEQGEANIVMDLKGNTLTARGLTLLTGTATVKNGTAPGTVTAMGTNVTLQGLNVTVSGGSKAVVINGTATIDDCTFVSEPLANFHTYALDLGSIKSNVTATNVTLIAGDAAYTTSSTATFVLDGVTITENCPTATYKTPGRA